MRFELFRTRQKQWRWRLRARNSRIIACSGEAYRRRIDCRNAIELVQMSDHMTRIVEVAR